MTTTKQNNYAVIKYSFDNSHEIVTTLWRGEEHDLIISSFAAFNLFGSRAIIVTFAPFLADWIAMLFPIPLEPPVI